MEISQKNMYVDMHLSAKLKQYKNHPKNEDVKFLHASENITTSNSPSVMVRGRYPTSFMTGTTIPALWKVLHTTFLFLALMADVLVSRLYFSFFASETSDVWSVFNDFCLDLPLEVFIKSAINLLRQWDNTSYCKSVRLGDRNWSFTMHAKSKSTVLYNI